MCTVAESLTRCNLRKRMQLKQKTKTSAIKEMIINLTAQALQILTTQTTEERRRKLVTTPANIHNGNVSRGPKNTDPAKMLFESCNRDIKINEKLTFQRTPLTSLSNSHGIMTHPYLSRVRHVFWSS